MSDLKSMLPDLEEVSSFAKKFFNDMRTSASEIADAYNKKRAALAKENKSACKPEQKVQVKTTEKTTETVVEKTKDQK